MKESVAHEALAKTVDLMKHYANIKSKYKDKLHYIEKVKKELPVRFK